MAKTGLEIRRRAAQVIGRARVAELADAPDLGFHFLHLHGYLRVSTKAKKTLILLVGICSSRVNSMFQFNWQYCRKKCSKLVQAPITYPKRFSTKAPAALVFSPKFFTSFPKRCAAVGPPPTRMCYRVVEPADHDLKVFSTNWLEHDRKQFEFDCHADLPGRRLNVPKNTTDAPYFQRSFSSGYLTKVSSPHHEAMPMQLHQAEAFLPIDYPRRPPFCRMTTPVFHPNIDPQKICIGDHWSAGQSLAQMVVHIAAMICYQSYNLKSPLNAKAAAWAEQNMTSLPLQQVDLSVGL